MCFDKEYCEPAREVAEMLKQWELDFQRKEQDEYKYRYQWQRELAIFRAEYKNEPIPTFDHLPPALEM